MIKATWLKKALLISVSGQELKQLLNGYKLNAPLYLGQTYYLEAGATVGLDQEAIHAIEGLQLKAKLTELEVTAEIEGKRQYLKDQKREGNYG